MSNQVIVVGGGFSGLSAVHTVLERAFGVQDSAEIFAQDTARSARDLAHPDLIKVLIGNSASVVEWLQEKFKLDFSLPDRACKEGDAVIGVEYVKDGQTCKEYGPVILATGDIYNLPTTNGEHSIGDGHKMVIAIGGKATHMEKVQVHPTGLVDLKSLMQKSAEALRGVGWLLLNCEGKRFCDELGHRDYVTGEIWKQRYQFVLYLIVKKLNGILKHYVGRGLMRKFSDEALAKEIGISASQLKATFDDYNDIASNKKKDPFDKKFFHNVPISINDHPHITLYYEQVIPGLFTSGEIAGGVHDANRLGGSSLLGFVVYGRVAGDSASRYLFQNLSSATANCRLEQIAGQLAPYQTTVSVDQTHQNKISWGLHTDALSQYTLPVQAPQASPSQIPAPEKNADASTREKNSRFIYKFLTPKFFYWFTFNVSVLLHCWVIVNGEVLNVTNFLPAILIYAGKDATRKFSFDLFFNMLHDKGVVKKYSPKSIIGTLKR
ncbi:hypothetical protein C2G38_2099623 [Gigaspora rosea]|uniref:FAD/NAD(P)-binding domain-containing protein n=1 Tax=Gigaspora rosea TaxID=44941 RepID=A0A397URX4_9GLOM|nr:hypothetical protein C2G38_2099623 [Gigaspora rosea]